jgi:hypothetical protein
MCGRWCIKFPEEESHPAFLLSQHTWDLWERYHGGARDVRYDHNGEDDLDLLHADMVEVFGDLFFVGSDRGNNSHIKLDYTGHGWPEVAAVLTKLDRLVKALAKKRQRKSVPEIKGKPSARRDHYGTLAKLPLKGWTEERLEEFKALPTKSFYG